MQPGISGTEAAHGSAQYLEMTLVLVDDGNALVLLAELCRLRELCRDRDAGTPVDAAAPFTPAPGSVVCQHHITPWVT